MPKKNSILNIPGFTIGKISGNNPINIEIYYKNQVRCIHCQNKKLRKKSSFIRRIRHESIGLRQIILSIKAYKFYCAKCNKYFNQRFPGIGKYQRATENLKRQVFYSHTQGISQKDLANNLKVGRATIERWYHQRYEHEGKRHYTTSLPRVLGIDEHFFSKKQGYATTFCNLEKRKIFDIVKGRSTKDLAAYLKSLPNKERVKVICIDLSSSYRSIVKRYFPHAKIVADRFHVIRLINHMCMQTYNSIDQSMRYQRGLLAALKTNPENLTHKRLQLRDNYLTNNPAIKHIYHFKQRLHRLLTKKHCTAKQCRRLLPIFTNMVNGLKQTPFEQLAKLGRTLHQWREEVVRMWRFTRNNGITEGFHRKMKLIQRRAYGFRNFENYRLRVKVLCG